MTKERSLANLRSIKRKPIWKMLKSLRSFRSTTGRKPDRMVCVPVETSQTYNSATARVRRDKRWE